MKVFWISAVILLVSVQISSAQPISKISKDELVQILNNPSGKLHVVNFWATWCAPCVAELSGFQEVVNKMKSDKVDFLFVSLDFPSDGEQKLTAFMKKNHYSFKVALMTETDANSWIDLVDPSWQGDIPSTLFVNNSRKIHQFHSGAMDKNKLEKTIQTLLTN